MDDPLSAVDAHVGIHIFEKCVGPNLKDADWIIILNDVMYSLNSGSYHSTN